MTERLYYRDAYRRAFDAIVTRVLEHESRPAAVLDRTAFYPTSGGQPFDIGRLGGAAVVDVVDVGGDVVHVLDGPLAAGAAVHGEIDWSRRFDHMQQHTGQHVLSAAFDRCFDNRTTSVHFGAALCTIDLAREQTAADVERAVDAANQVVWEDRPVSVRFASEEEARALPLRKESQRQGELRLVEVADFDLSACGGTHVERTGAIGLIAAVHAERFKGGLRVSFACGGRALRLLRDQRDVLAATTRTLSVLPAELAGAVEKLQAEAKGLRKQVSGFQIALAQQEAAQLLAAAPAAGGTRVVVKVYDGWDANGLKAIASSLAAGPGVAAALVSAAMPALVVVARSADVAVDAGAVVRELTARFGGRGGGKPDLAQAGGLSADPSTLADAARAVLSRGRAG